MIRPRANDAEVCVVGAGPAGSTAARRLAELGREVVLVDRSPGPREEIICTGIVGQEAFERLDLPRRPVVDVVRRARFFSPSGVEVTYEPREPLARVVDRTRFDAALAGRAVRAGARLLRGFEVRGLERTGSGVVLREADGERPLRARAVVVATGHWQWLHGPAGLGTPDDHVQGVHADLPFGPTDGAELYFGNGVAPGFFAWNIPFGPGTARLGVLAPGGARPLFRRFLRKEPIRSRLRVNLENGGREKVRRALLCRGIVQGAVRPSFADRVLAVGEAAGQVKTTTAGGIYYGMLGAEVAAEVLDDALRAGRPEALSAASLARYEEAWRGRLGTEIDAGLDLQAAAREMSDEQIDDLFGALQAGLGAAVRQVVRFDWHRPALGLLLRRLRRRVLAAVG